MTKPTTNEMMDAAKVDCMERGCRCDVLVIATQVSDGVWEISCAHEPFCILVTPADGAVRADFFGDETD